MAGPLPLTGACAAALVTLAGCRSADVASLNLEELHDEDGTHKYVARVKTGFRGYMSVLFNPEWLADDSALRSEDAVTIASPEGLCLESMNQLMVPTVGSAKHFELERVRHFAWLAVVDPWSLSRERALLELADFAERLGLAAPLADPGEAANAAEISEAIAGLVEAVRPILASKKRSSDTEKRDFAAACELMAGLEYDLEGGRRMLRIISSFAARTDIKNELFAPLVALADTIERRMIGIALARGLHDESALARAAAFETHYRVFGDRFLAEAILALDGERREGEPNSFGLDEEWPGEEEVFVRVLGLVREHGLPYAGEANDPAARRARLDLLHVLVQVAYDFSAYSDRTRTAAMLALSEGSGAGFESLHKEVWEEWWVEYARAEEDSLRGGPAPDRPGVPGNR